MEANEETSRDSEIREFLDLVAVTYWIFLMSLCTNMVSIHGGCMDEKFW